MKNILMNVEMTKAILDGHKVQTRRVVQDRILLNVLHNPLETDAYKQNVSSKGKYKIGETIWVREPVRVLKYITDTRMILSKYLSDNDEIALTLPKRFIHDCNSSENDFALTWAYQKQGIPNGCIKEMARIFLKVTNVRVERLQEISEQDIWSEGTSEITDCEMSWKCNAYDGYTSYEKAIGSFKKLWNKTAPKGYKWENNPYVFVYEFERVDK